MSVYADTSFLLSYFGQDTHTLSAYRYATAWSRPPCIPWTLFGKLEFHNAARSLIFSGKLDLRRLQAMQLRVEEDLHSGILAVQTLPSDRLFDAAEAVSTAYAVRTGARTLDVIHVAAATLLGAKDFISFDLRQRQLAKLCGFNLPPFTP